MARPTSLERGAISVLSTVHDSGCLGVVRQSIVRPPARDETYEGDVSMLVAWCSPEERGPVVALHAARTVRRCTVTTIGSQIQMP